MTAFSPRKTASPATYAKETRGENFFEKDLNAQRVLERIAPDMLARNFERLKDFGAFVGAALDEQAAYSDRHAPPELQTHNKNGEKKSRVLFNPKYEAAHQEAYKRGAIGLAFADKDPEPHLLSFTMGYMLSQADISVHCPVTMTGAVAYVLDKFAPKDVRDEFLHEMTRMDGETKTGGTWATELHGGSDVGATTTVAKKEGDKITLHGLKWFTSNANSGLALATARPEGAPAGSKGLGLYLVPSHLATGEQNSYSIRRLKDKLGTKGLATGEIDLEGAEVIEIAPPPHGLKIMMEALEYSRIHNAMGAAGVTRRAFLEAASWAEHRSAFGREIINYPMVQNELFDLMMRSEAATALAFEAARTFDVALQDDTQRTWLRLSTALAKYRTAEDGVQCAKKALELVGGNGYTEEFPTARQYRDAMVLTVWEGPANIQALELLRMVVGKEPGDDVFVAKIREISDALPAEMGGEKAILDTGLKQAMNALIHLRAHPEDGERFARKLLDHMSDVLAGALLAEEAAHDLTLGDARKALVARRYLEKAFGDRALKLSSDADPVHTHFRAIVSYAPIAPSSLGYVTPANDQAAKPRQKGFKP
ncbi:MAG TPA: acyl-CoA dehydrogenase family protein [Patescibacteria group bacterium]|nr:acyl-CoA dehydrogenase family protein [Patescibacteria group bacterium]